MTQPIEIITDAMSSIGVIAPGEQLEPQLAQEALRMLNRMLDQWSNQELLTYDTNEIIADIGGLGTDVTIGPEMMIDVPTPINIQSAFVRVNSSLSMVDFKVQILNIEQYELIGLKQLNGPWPRALWYNRSAHTGVIKFWPNPSSGEIHLFSANLLTKFVTINDTVNIPPGYEMAMMWSLAKLLIPAYGKTSDQVLVQMVNEFASSAIADIKSSNSYPVQTVSFDSAIVSGKNADAGWILTGGF